MIDEGKLAEIKKRCLVVDIETAASYEDGTPIDIRANFEDYLRYAKTKFFGAYSYATNEHHLLEVKNNVEFIMGLLEQHDVIVTFNGEDFDVPIVKNNGLFPQEEAKYYDYEIDAHPLVDKKMTQVDMMVTLGQSVYLTRSGYKYKGRANLMGVKLKNNSLRHMAEAFGVETQKGDIDYNIFYKDSWTEEELAEIKKYLKADVDATKELFDKTWEFWKSFTEFIDDKNIENLSWIRSSIASLTYKAACHSMGVEETYSDSTDEKEKMGGRVLDPVDEEAENCIIVDWSSLYPHIMAMFNLFAEVEAGTEGAFHGNDLFTLKGYYDVENLHILSGVVAERLKERIRLKKEEPDNPKIFSYKIFLNSLYGAARSSIFEKVHTPNCGWDTASLGQQMTIIAEEMMDEFGFTTIYSDTDSLMLKAKEKRFYDKKYIRECLDKVRKRILDNVPFPLETFDMDIENECPYMMFPFSLQPIKDEEGNNIKKGNRLVKERKGKKKNYLYLFKKKDGSLGLKIKGLPIIKDTATQLGQKILNDIIKPLIIQRKRAKFSKEEMDHILEVVLKKDGALELLQQEYKVKTAKSYKNPNQIQAQISAAYFAGDAGVIYLIKNKEIGKVGKGMKYATIDEVRLAGLTIDQLDLTKLNNELEPFVIA